MTTSNELATANVSTGADDQERRTLIRNEAMSAIQQLLKRMSYGRLRAVEQLIRSDAGRVISPRSAHGMALFSRLQEVDAVFARCEQKLMRDATLSDSRRLKIEIDDQMFTLSAVMTETAAKMAVDCDIENASNDRFVNNRIREMKAELRLDSDIDQTQGDGKKERKTRGRVEEPQNDLTPTDTAPA